MWSPSDYSTQPFQNRHKNSCRALRLCSSELTYLWVTPHVHDSKLEDVIQLLYFIYLCQEVKNEKPRIRTWMYRQYVRVCVCVHTHTHILSSDLQTNSETNLTITYWWRFPVYQDSFGEWKRTSPTYLKRKNRLQCRNMQPLNVNSLRTQGIRTVRWRIRTHKLENLEVPGAVTMKITFTWDGTL
jgi:hypothetical protein